MTVRHVAHLLIVAAATLPAGCGLLGGDAAPAAPPAWLAQPAQHPACDDALLCGVGTSQLRGTAAIEQARRGGLQQISASILVDVQSEIVAATRSVLENGEAQWTEDLAENITLRSDSELPAARVIETYENPVNGDTAVLVGVPRLALVDKWLPELESAVGQADELVRQATAAGDTDPIQALTMLTEAQRTVNSVWVLANKLRVVANRTSASGRIAGPFNRTSSLVGSLASEITRHASSMRLTIVSGDGQRGRIRGHLPAPLLVEATLRNAEGEWRPLAGLPLAFHAAPGQLEVQPAGGTTGPDGRLRVLASALRRVPGARSAVRVAPDFGADSALVGLPEVTFRYTLPNAADTRILLVAEATLDSAAVPGDDLLSSLAGHLGAAGFDVQTYSPGDTRNAQLMRAPATELASMVGRDIDYVLRASGHITPSSDSGGLHWFTALGEFEAIGLDDASVFPLATPTVKGAHTNASVEGARRVLLRELLPVMRQTLDEQFIVDFIEHTPTSP
ncbi:MAG: hypothetical protein DHS20C15_28340 [Planctomycetota bacterium]|nr:MAG: hypothetical protein DHS20C15_28340 [Planctomycetota bacterium]